MPKPFMTYEQQLQKLRDKHLCIPDEAAAKELLQRHGYFSLVSGYKDLFKDPSTRNYRDGTTLQDIWALYQFDESLRELTLRHLLHIERHIRSMLSYAFCSAFGESQQAYLDPAHYDYGAAWQRRTVDQLIQKYLQPLLHHPTDYPYIEHHKRTYQNVPLWVLMQALTFGTLSKMYRVSRPSLKSSVSRAFEAVNERQLEQMLRVLTTFRNVCAHGERLFSYRCARYEIPDLPLHRKLSVPQRGSQYLYGKRDYFALVLCFRYLLPKSEFLAYKKQLSLLIGKAAACNGQISEAQLLEIMGLPPNWKKITTYRKA